MQCIRNQAEVQKGFTGAPSLLSAFSPFVDPVAQIALLSSCSELCDSDGLFLAVLHGL